MKLVNYITPLRLQAIPANFIDLNYTPLNPTGLELPCSIIRFINTTNMTVFVGWGDVNEAFIINQAQVLQINLQDNHSNVNHMSYCAKGTIFTVNTDIVPAKPAGIFCMAAYSSFNNKA